MMRCKGCGKITNTATSDAWHHEDFIARKCYVAWEDDGRAIEGCGYEEADIFDKEFADKLLVKES